MKNYTHMGMRIEPLNLGWVIFDDKGIMFGTAPSIKKATGKIDTFRKSQGSDYKPLENKMNKILDPTMLGSV